VQTCLDLQSVRLNRMAVWRIGRQVEGPSYYGFGS
jgi:hypothetical protein